MKFLKKLFKNKFDNTRQNKTDYNTNAKNYVNSKNFSSKTKYLIWVDLKNFKVNIFSGSKNNWKSLKSYLCTIGKISTPTPKGKFTTGIKGLYFGVNKGYKCWYYTQFKGNYLFHSIIYNLDGSVRDGRLGMALSDGCIRLAKINAKWIWDNIPRDTTVVIS
ncbi:L,D-transpeptidase [Clostridium weizhouense]|uniref:L,D-transpeptidase n=1 Tax=Clostridium weizhouense TaxID=2859781 RepID=A0ABS7AN98_9CLOT|nr:L,D-transpeptidase [Clostridium weizhouense]MBW6409558.1 L,D-transpeptidase [Clostridium weizhouense]